MHLHEHARGGVERNTHKYCLHPHKKVFQQGQVIDTMLHKNMQRTFHTPDNIESDRHLPAKDIAHEPGYIKLEKRVIKADSNIPRATDNNI